MATPLTLGHTFLFLEYLWNWFPAFKMGLSVLPPPAAIPTVALQCPEMVFLAPEGNLILDFSPSSE